MSDDFPKKLEPEKTDGEPEAPGPWKPLPEDDPGPAAPVGRNSKRGALIEARRYELMVIIDPEIDERMVAPSLDRFLGVIRNDGGTVDNVDIWGRRRLAYEIDKHTEGIYAVVQLTATSATTQELSRQLGLSEAILRTKILRAEEAVARVAEVDDVVTRNEVQDPRVTRRSQRRERTSGR